MSTPQRIQRKRTKGWKMPPNAISVARPGPYGNPFVVGRDGTAEQCVAKFRAAWEEGLRLASFPPRSPPMPFGNPVYLGPLIGKNLACWCQLDKPCHADVLLELAASPTTARVTCTRAPYARKRVNQTNQRRKTMTILTQPDFIAALKAATDRLWTHRSAMHRVAMRIGFWPHGMVISATISARDNKELLANTNSPHVIPWDEVATLTEQRLIEIVDEVCAPAYEVLGIVAA